MISSRKIIIWTILTHALIVVGYGHGIIFFGLIEVFTFPYFNNNINLGLDAGFEEHLQVVGLASLLGQLILIASLFLSHSLPKRSLHLLGLGLLLISIGYFQYHDDHGSVHFLYLSAMPFVFCVLLTFAQRYFVKLFRWMIE